MEDPPFIPLYQISPNKPTIKYKILTKNIRIPQGIADHLCYIKLRNSGEIYSNPGIATLVLFVLLPIFEGAVIGLVLWLIYRKVGIEKITLYIMVVYLIASFILTLILNVDYNSENVAFSILVFIENHILSSVVFVCSILSMTVYGYRFKQFFSKVFETEEEDKR